MLRERLKKEIVVFDGAMGTRLQEEGLGTGHPPDEWNISHPEKVLAVHMSYVEAGSDMIQTNTFGSNRLQLRKHGLDDKIRLINQRAVQIAREAINKKHVLLAASIGPLGEFLEPFGNLTEEKARETFREQMEILREEGVMIFHLETFSSLQEVLIATEVALELKTEVIVSLTFQRRGDGNFITLMGETPQKIVSTLQDLPIVAIGSNCGTGIHEMRFLVKELRKHYQGFISCKPNAGIPQVDGDQILYTETPQDFAQVTQELIKVPVNIIGGCCGTTAEHIKAIRKAVDNYSSSRGA